MKRYALSTISDKVYETMSTNLAKLRSTRNAYFLTSNTKVLLLGSPSTRWYNMIIARLLKDLFIKMENKRISKIIASLKCLYIFLIFFNESKGKDHITTILTCLDTIPRFFSKKRWFLKTVKTRNIPLKLFLIYSEIPCKSKRNVFEMYLRVWGVELKILKRV